VWPSVRDDTILKVSMSATWRACCSKGAVSAGDFIDSRRFPEIAVAAMPRAGVAHVQQGGQDWARWRDALPLEDFYTQGESCPFFGCLVTPS
jgi:hypothetical protein